MTGVQASNRDRPRPRFPFKELARVLLIPAIAVAVFVLVFVDRPEGGSAPEEGMRQVRLVQKDAQFQIVPQSEGGATGTVWYTPVGEELEFELRAEGLEPGKKYLLELQVDQAIYTIASRAADEDAELAVDTTLTRFAEGVCVGPNYDPPMPLAGQHAIRFWVKKDGNPPSGTAAEHAPQVEAGRELPCSGNGDGDYGYVLLENEVANFIGAGGARSSTGSSRRFGSDGPRRVAADGRSG